MSANTQDVVGVGTATLETAQELCEKVSAMTVARRLKEYVGTSMNGEARAHTNPRAVSVRREMQREGGYAPIAGRLTLDAEDLDDGVPLALVLEPRLLEIAWLREHARPVRLDRPLSALNVRETKAEGRVNVSQIRLAEHPDDPTAIRDALDALDHYAQPFDELRECLRHRLVLADGGAPPRQFAGRRRGVLALHS